jgi:uncharacterized membrane protein YfcA
MNDQRPNRDAPPPRATINLHGAVAAVVAAALGAVAGGLAATLLPGDKFAWTGFALVPLFVLLEAALTHLAETFGGDRNAARLTLAGAIVAGFYAAWFGVRSL